MLRSLVFRRFSAAAHTNHGACIHCTGLTVFDTSFTYVFSSVLTFGLALAERNDIHRCCTNTGHTFSSVLHGIRDGSARFYGSCLEVLNTFGHHPTLS